MPAFCLVGALECWENKISFPNESNLCFISVKHQTEIVVSNYLNTACYKSSVVRKMNMFACWGSLGFEEIASRELGNIKRRHVLSAVNKLAFG